MTKAERIYRSTLKDMNDAYLSAVRSMIQGDASEHLWRSFRNRLEQTMRWADLTAAAKIRYGATHQKVILPEEEDYTLDDVVDLNPWFKLHHRITKRAIHQHARQVERQERDYFSDRIEDYDVDPDSGLPGFRMGMIHRNLLGEVQENSEQIELAGEPGDIFPYAVYMSMDDRRVRTTHAQMHGTVALRSWEGWSICRPKNGFNCRCYLAYRTMEYAIEQGWATKDGKPKWEVQWSSSKARRNFEAGTFPDPGWHGPKFVTA